MIVVGCLLLVYLPVQGRKYNSRCWLLVYSPVPGRMYNSRCWLFVAGLFTSSRT